MMKPKLSCAEIRQEITYITVCVCTYKRLQYLIKLLTELASQDTCGRFSFSVVVVDNDISRSAEDVVRQFSASSQLQVKYYSEARQGIALARNKAVENAYGDFLAFIDDDEFPAKDWLITLLDVCETYGVDGVLGPVKPHYVEQTPSWIRKGKFYDRPVMPTGHKVEWKNARTGNVLLKRDVFVPDEPAFRTEFRSGEDQDFFRRMIEKGRTFVWSRDAVVYEVVPPPRWNRRFMLRRALLRGASAALDPTLGAYGITKSIIAILVYTVALPLMLVLGQHRFMKVMIKLCDHSGKLLALVGANPIRQPYITG